MKSLRPTRVTRVAFEVGDEAWCARCGAPVIGEAFEVSTPGGTPDEEPLVEIVCADCGG